MTWLLSIAAGLLAVPLGFAAGTCLYYVWLACRGVTEHEGRRGLLAGTVGGPLGAIVAFCVSCQTGRWLLEGGGGSWRGFFTGCLIGVPAAAITGTAALYIGARIGERRMVTSHPGGRAAWALYHVAIPTAAITAAGGFLAGWWLTRS